jgi:hypothetical protein
MRVTPATIVLLLKRGDCNSGIICAAFNSLRAGTKVALGRGLEPCPVSGNGSMGGPDLEDDSMIAKLTSSERQSAAVVLLAVALVGIAMAAAGRNEGMGVHGLIVILFAGAFLYPVLSSFYAPEPTDDREVVLLRRPDQGRHRARHDRGRSSACSWASGSRRSSPGQILHFDGAWSTFGRLRPDAHHRCHLRLRRQRADRHILPCRAAHVARPSRGPDQPLVRAVRLQPFLRAGCVRLSDGHHAIEGICRGGVVCRPLAGRRLGHLLRALFAQRSHGARSRTSTSPTGISSPSSWLWRSSTS